MKRFQAVLSNIGKSLFILFMPIRIAAVCGQHLDLEYRATVPEAGLFFIHPSCLNPAKGGGSLSIFTNPAGLASVQKREIWATFNLADASTARLGLEIKDWSLYTPARIETDASIKEIGGLGSVGAAMRKGRWRFGAALLQPRRAGVRFQLQGTTSLSTQFEFDKPITREEFHALPVDSLPIRWNVLSDAQLKLEGTPVELMLTETPLAAAVSYGSRHFSLGVGLVYTRYSSGNQSGSYRTELTAHSAITGSPAGTNPITGEPWQGSITADLDLTDSPLSASYRFHVDGKRLGVSCGALMDYKLFSIGASYSYQFDTTLRGSYEFTTISTRGLPLESFLSDVQLDLSATPEIGGRAKLKLANFAKDTLKTFAEGSVHLSGAHSLALGCRIFILGLFAMIEAPESEPNLLTSRIGIYTDFKLPVLPIKANLGYLQSVNAAVNNSKAVPYRVITHLGGGISSPLPFQKRIGFLDKMETRLRLGVRSSLTSLALKVIENSAVRKSEKRLPSPLQNLAFSFGIETSF